MGRLIIDRKFFTADGKTRKHTIGLRCFSKKSAGGKNVAEWWLYIMNDKGRYEPIIGTKIENRREALSYLFNQLKNLKPSPMERSVIKSGATNIVVMRLKNGDVKISWNIHIKKISVENIFSDLKRVEKTIASLEAAIKGKQSEPKSKLKKIR